MPCGWDRDRRARARARRHDRPLGLRLRRDPRGRAGVRLGGAVVPAARARGGAARADRFRAPRARLAPRPARPAAARARGAERDDPLPGALERGRGDRRRRHGQPARGHRADLHGDPRRGRARRAPIASGLGGRRARVRGRRHDRARHGRWSLAFARRAAGARRGALAGGLLRLAEGVAVARGGPARTHSLGDEPRRADGAPARVRHGRGARLGSGRCARRTRVPRVRGVRARLLHLGLRVLAHRRVGRGRRPIRGPAGGCARGLARAGRAARRSQPRGRGYRARGRGDHGTIAPHPPARDTPPAWTRTSRTSTASSTVT